MGTESPDLLLEEYHAARDEFAVGGTARMGIRQQRVRDTLLERRDHYIADRINSTLAAGETGVLFIGMLHAVTNHLNPDIKVIYPLRRPPLRQGIGA
jgi:hypothetical protein